MISDIILIIYLTYVRRFIEVFNAAVYDFAARRLLLYTMAHTFKDYAYLPRVVNSLFSYIEAVHDRNSFMISKL